MGPPALGGAMDNGCINAGEAAPVPDNTPVLCLEHDDPGGFALLLQTGVLVPASQGLNLQSFLCAVLGIDPEYLDQRVQTVFLNGLAVDDLGRAAVGPGARVALSAALPGLAGATMRRGGFYAGMRQGVTYVPAGVERPSGEFLVNIRFFNMVGAELCERLLARGVYVEAEALKAFLQRRPGSFLAGMRLAGTAPGAASDASPVMDHLARLDGIILLNVHRP